MTRQSTSLALANSAGDEWRRYLAFVKRPHLPARAHGFSGASLLATLRMLGLDLLMMLGLVLIAGLVVTLGFEFPDNEINGLTWDPQTIALVVVVAPLVEEIAFRSWLSGRIGHWLALVPLVIGVMVVGGMDFAGFQVEAKYATAAVTAGLVALILYALRRHEAMRWFVRFFPVFFWLSTFGFAMMHLFNYTEGALVFLLPLVLPQLITGTILGYVRVHYGLWASVLLHALHNGSAVGAVVLAMKLGIES